MKKITQIANDLYARIDSVDWDKIEESTVTKFKTTKVQITSLAKQLGLPIVLLIVATFGIMVADITASEPKYEADAALLANSSDIGQCLGILAVYKGLYEGMLKNNPNFDKEIANNSIAFSDKATLPLKKALDTALDNNQITRELVANSIVAGGVAANALLDRKDYTTFKVLTQTCAYNAEHHVTVK